MIDKDLLAALAVMSLLVAVFGLLMLALVLRSRHNTARPDVPLPDPGPRGVTTGPWHRQIASFFPSYYTPWAGVASVLLILAAVVVRASSAGRPPSWQYALMFLPVSFILGHMGAFVVDFARAKMGGPKPDDVAKPVDYYTADMQPASYQPSFRTLSSLIKCAPWLMATLVGLMVVEALTRQVTIVDLILQSGRLAGVGGFWLGCVEIQRGVTVRRS